MELRLVRQPSDSHRTHGDLYMDGQWFCYTLEDPVREVKIPGKTAIWGDKTYPVIMSLSARFKRRLPLIKDVDQFEGVRIHAGNTAEDTDGCILVGRKRNDATISESRLALEELLTEIEAAIQNGEEVTLTIENANT